MTNSPLDPSFLSCMYMYVEAFAPSATRIVKNVYMRFVIGYMLCYLHA